MSVKFKDNSKEVLDKLKINKAKTLTDIGMQAVEVTKDYMAHKYYKDIHLSGDLKRDVNYKPRLADDAVDIGNSLNYAIWVHEGTGKMKARPYLRDAITQNTAIWKDIAVKHLGDGFGGEITTSFSLD